MSIYLKRCSSAHLYSAATIKLTFKLLSADGMHQLATATLPSTTISEVSNAYGRQKWARLDSALAMTATQGDELMVQLEARVDLLPNDAQLMPDFRKLLDDARFRFCIAERVMWLIPPFWAVTVKQSPEASQCSRTKRCCHAVHPCSLRC
jgi:hypothetical protein